MFALPLQLLPCLLETAFSFRRSRRDKQNITVKLDVNIESRAVAAVREEILSRQCDSSIVFLKDKRRGLEQAHHRDTVPLKQCISFW